VEPSDFSCRRCRITDIWELADQKRALLWPTGELPIDVEKIIECQLRLDIDWVHGLLQEADVDAFLKSDLTGFIVDYDSYMNDKFENRRRFSYAHELGHYFLHEDVYRQMKFESLEEWKRFVMNISDREYAAFEFQANEFAGRFLVPKQILNIEIDKAIDVLIGEGLSDILIKNADVVSPYIAAYVHKKFGVSKDVIERRIDREGLWPPK